MVINKRLLINTTKCLMAILIASLTFSAPAFADEIMQKDVVAAYSKNNTNNNTPKSSGRNETYKPVNSWKPYYTWIGNVQSQTERMFMQSSIGLGFMYFSDVKVNPAIIPAPAGSINQNVVVNETGGFSYNRVPVYEYDLGYTVFNWMKLAVSIQNQMNISIQSQYESTVSGGAHTAASFPKYQFRANLNLNSVSAKVMFELPWVMVWKNAMYTPYFNASVGAGWQSWTDIRQYAQYLNSAAESTFVNTLHQKYVANCVWGLDAGFRIKSAVPTSNLSLLLGCKFNSWSQVRNIGKADQQGAWGYAIKSPLRVKMLYSFAPYVGGQWNF